MYMCVRVYSRVSTCSRVLVHVSMYVCVLVCALRVHVHVCSCVLVRVNMCVYTCDEVT